ncbi:MAG: hypothetical protein O7C63_09790 [Alphaproteobacteria bacterium]|nr:hypothetical protein [Alphaproteobacteria bacterium]
MPRLAILSLLFLLAGCGGYGMQAGMHGNMPGDMSMRGGSYPEPLAGHDPMRPGAKIVVSPTTPHYRQPMPPTPAPAPARRYLAGPCPQPAGHYRGWGQSTATLNLTSATACPRSTTTTHGQVRTVIYPLPFYAVPVLPVPVYPVYGYGRTGYGAPVVFSRGRY